MQKTIPLFMRNLDYIKELSGISQEHFCGRKLPWTSSDKDMKNGVIVISKSTYNRWKSEGVRRLPSNETMEELIGDLNELRKRHSFIAKCFPTEFTKEALLHTDLKAELDDTRQKETDDLQKTPASALMNKNLFTEKFEQTYMCYYYSTNIQGEQKLQTGILRLSKGERDNEFKAVGVFSQKNEENTLKIFTALKENKSLNSTIGEIQNQTIRVFKGTAYLSLTWLWCNLSTEDKSEHVSFSFDLSPKTTNMYPEKSFLGARGIALSQSSGLSSQSITFPIIILSEPASAKQNELAKFLHFDYTKIDRRATQDLTQKTVNLMKSLIEHNFSDESLRFDLIVHIIVHEIQDLLSKHTFNSHYFRSGEMDEFYSRILKPIRQILAGETEDPDYED